MVLFERVKPMLGVVEGEGKGFLFVAYCYVQGENN